MNRIQLTLRTADAPRITREEAGVPTFATVFALHNIEHKGRAEAIPITVKASMNSPRFLRATFVGAPRSSWMGSSLTSTTRTRTGNPIRSGPMP